MYQEQYFTGTNKDGYRVVVCKLTGCGNSLEEDLEKKGWEGYHGFFGGPFMLPDSFEGKAKCDPRDTYDEEIGKKIAKERALAKLARAKNVCLKEYMDYMAADYSQSLKDITDIMGRNKRFLDNSSKTIERIFAGKEAE